MPKFYPKLPDEIESIGRAIVNSSFKIHKKLGPGLLERIYESCLEYELKKSGLHVERQVSIPIVYEELRFKEGFVMDLFVERKVIVELKAVDHMNPVFEAQLISYLKMTGLELGYLINFNSKLIKDGIHRYRN